MALLGVTANALPWMPEWETAVGLDWLFGLRGARPAPPEVIVVAVDRESAARLALPNAPERWPRALHAKLIDRLADAGARVIAFDVFFRSPRDAVGDQALAEAIARAGNVVLVDFVEEGLAPVAGVAPDDAYPQLATATLIRPLRRFADAAVATGPFLLPRVPDRVNLFWLYSPAAGDAPTLPVLALRHYLGPSQADPTRDPAARYLDFYGPPRSVTTLPYYRLVMEGAASTSGVDVKGKAVFVGFSERYHVQKQDYFHTVFSQPDGTYLSGVEIAATAFANLLEGRQVRPLSTTQHLAVLLVWGFVLGCVLMLLPPSAAVLAAAGASAFYVGIAGHLFAADGTWSPMVVPMLVQAPLALMTALLWRYLDTHRERQRIREAFGRYLPAPVVDALARGRRRVAMSPEDTFGVCLYTDAEGFTAIGERLSPADLEALLGRYFAVLFEAVSRHGGFVSDVIGDAMMAIWAADEPPERLKAQACAAAREILAGVEDFNRRETATPLPTRVGIDCGEIRLGDVGAGTHYEYRAVGDAVNTATRLEGLNKLLGTKALVSEAVAGDQTAEATRELGIFLVRGKRAPIVVHELVAKPVDWHPRFEAALRTYRDQRWSKAIAVFAELADRYHDGPSSLYRAKCERLQRDGTPPGWTGVIEVDET